MDPLATAPTDVLLVSSDWRSRALIRAQLIEEGLEVEALEAWPEAERILLRRRDKPLVVVMDLAGAADAASAMTRLGELMPPDRVLILTGSPSPARDEVLASGFDVLSRPLAIRDVIARTRALVDEHRRGKSSVPKPDAPAG
jgi:DNA-binding response OmpR family regulator